MLRAEADDPEDTMEHAALPMARPKYSGQGAGDDP
jgi:hypothetical protein